MSAPCLVTRDLDAHQAKIDREEAEDAALEAIESELIAKYTARNIAAALQRSDDNRRRLAAVLSDAFRDLPDAVADLLLGDAPDLAGFASWCRDQYIADARQDAEVDAEHEAHHRAPAELARRRRSDEEDAACDAYDARMAA